MSYYSRAREWHDVFWNLNLHIRDIGILSDIIRLTLNESSHSDHTTATGWEFTMYFIFMFLDFHYPIFHGMFFLIMIYMYTQKMNHIQGSVPGHLHFILVFQCQIDLILSTLDSTCNCSVGRYFLMVAVRICTLFRVSEPKIILNFII